MRPILALILLTLLILGCATLSPTPTATATALPSPTFTPTKKPIPTPQATHTERPPTQTPSPLGEMVPEGKPAEEWEGIPIMPGAIKGGGDGQGYTFLIEATREQVADFYNAKLANLGWEPFAHGEGDSGTVMLMYQSGGEILTIALLESEGEGMIVMIIK